MVPVTKKPQEALGLRPPKLGTADIDAAVTVADRLRRTLAENPIPLGPTGAPLTIRVSIGAAQHTGETAQALVRRADTALYQAKHAGRDTVRIAADLVSADA